MERFSAKLGLGFLWLLSFLPYGFVARFGEGLGGLLYRIPSGRRRVVLANLRACFPEKSEAEREAEFFTKLRPLSLIKRLIEADEVGAMTAYLASPLAAATNGAAVKVEGGMVPTIY